MPSQSNGKPARPDALTEKIAGWLHAFDGSSDVPDTEIEATREAYRARALKVVSIVRDHDDANGATNREREAIKLARSMDEAALRRVIGEDMTCWTPEQLRRHGSATFVLARRKEA